MGPLATVDFLEKLVRNTPATRDQDHIETLVCSAARIPDRIAGMTGEGPDPFPAMLAALRRLEAGGATRIAIACNTAHHWHGALQAETKLPILHIVDAVADALDGRTGDAIGLLATNGMLRSGIYQRRLGELGFACVVPDAADQAEVVRAIALVKRGGVAEASEILRPRVEALVAAGCRRVVMACTEIPIALAGAESALSAALLDPTEALARACIAACLGEWRIANGE